MRIRHPWLFVGVGISALALLVVGTVALAGEDTLILRSMTPQWTWGEPVDLRVRIDPGLVGGNAELWYQVEGHAEVLAQTFDLTLPIFAVPTQLPSDQSYDGLKIRYWYQAFAPWGEPVGESNPIGRKPKPPIDWD